MRGNSIPLFFVHFDARLKKYLFICCYMSMRFDKTMEEWEKAEAINILYCILERL